jgi:hypothetical protein
MSAIYAKSFLAALVVAFFLTPLAFFIASFFCKAPLRGSVGDSIREMSKTAFTFKIWSLTDKEFATTRRIPTMQSFKFPQRITSTTFLSMSVRWTSLWCAP